MLMSSSSLGDDGRSKDLKTFYSLLEDLAGGSAASACLPSAMDASVGRNGAFTFSSSPVNFVARAVQAPAWFVSVRMHSRLEPAASYGGASPSIVGKARMAAGTIAGRFFD